MTMRIKSLKLVNLKPLFENRISLLSSIRQCHCKSNEASRLTAQDIKPPLHQSKAYKPGERRRYSPFEPKGKFMPITNINCMHLLNNVDSLFLVLQIVYLK